MKHLAWLVLLMACTQAQPSGVPVDPAAEFSAVRYSDTGLTSVNQECAVTGEPLSPEIEPVYANGHPVGFC